jgi:hypothetical protein
MRLLRASSLAMMLKPLASVICGRRLIQTRSNGVEHDSTRLRTDKNPEVLECGP